MAISPVDPVTTTAVGGTATVYTFLGLPMSSWIALGTAIFILMQVFAYTPKAYNTAKAWYRKIFKHDSRLFDELAGAKIEDELSDGNPDG